MFPTFQGEGTYAGQRALFIRLAHCNLQCSWCDTEFDSYTKQTLKELEQKIRSFGGFKYYVITGGEPTIHPVFQELISLLDQILQENYKTKDGKVLIESNGTSNITRFKNPDRIFYTISPKQASEAVYDEPFYVHLNNYCRVDEFKLVIDKNLREKKGVCLNLMDDLAGSVPVVRNVALSLSPEYNEMKINVDFIYKLIERDSRWRLSLQTHKWIGYE